MTQSFVKSTLKPTGYALYSLSKTNDMNWVEQMLGTNLWKLHIKRIGPMITVHGPKNPTMVGKPETQVSFWLNINLWEEIFSRN